MMSADFTRAILTRTDLRGVDLRTAIGLTPEQIEQAVIDKKTRLPDDLDALFRERAERAREETVARN